jgi:hypothetical protein
MPEIITGGLIFFEIQVSDLLKQYEEQQSSLNKPMCIVTDGTQHVTVIKNGLVKNVNGKLASKIQSSFYPYYAQGSPTWQRKRRERTIRRNVQLHS